MYFEHSRVRLVTLILSTLMSTLPLMAQQSSPPPPGVYHCTNGFILTISRCGKIQGADACDFKIENNGKVLMDAPGSASGVSKMLAKCQDPAQAGSSTSGPAVATNPPYLTEMPAPARILAEIKGKDTEDTGERQMGAFRNLVQIIDDMAWGLGHRNVSDADSRAATPDERRLRFAYETAYADLWHKVTNKEGHVYDHDLALRHELLQKFFTDNFRAQYFQSNKTDAAEYAAFEKRMNPTPPAGAGQTGPGGQHYATDAGSVAVRKCVESGRSEIECLGEGMKVGLVDLAGKDSFMGKTLQDNKDPGLRLTGVYSAADTGMVFQQDVVTFACADLVRDPHQYSVQASGSQVRVTIASAPKPLIFSFQDGKLIGPGTIDVLGRVPIGGPVTTTSTAYQTETHAVTTREEIPQQNLPMYAGESDVQTNGSESYIEHQSSYTTTAPFQMTHHEIPTKPKTAHCNIGVVPATGETIKSADIATTVLGSQASKSQNTKPGLRLNGTYAAQGGLSIDFRWDSATLECGQAGNSEGYSVVPQNGHLVVNFDNKTGPFSLVLQPNGSLSGQGSIEVAGRRIIQGTGTDPNHFVPVNARCTLGTMAPQAAQ